MNNPNQAALDDAEAPVIDELEGLDDVSAGEEDDELEESFDDDSDDSDDDDNDDAGN